MRLFLFLGIVGSELFAVPAAQALNAPAEIPIAGNSLQISGGIDGYVYGQSGTAPKGEPGASAVGDSAYGANLTNALISVQKSSGVLQFTLELGPVDGLPVLGTAPPQPACLSLQPALSRLCDHRAERLAFHDFHRTN